MKVYPVLESDLRDLSCVPISYLDEFDFDDLSGQELRFIVSEGGQNTFTKYLSKFITLETIRDLLKKQMNYNRIYDDVINLSNTYIKRSDWPSVEISVDNVPTPYIISSFTLSNGTIINCNGYWLNDALSTQIPELDFTMVHAEVLSTTTLSAKNVFIPIIDVISSIIPEEATTSNKLADKNFVQTVVKESASSYRGTFGNKSQVPTDSSGYLEDYYGSKVPTMNDYIIILSADTWRPDLINGSWRFSYNGVWSERGINGWQPEYNIHPQFNDAQYAAINSGITNTNKITRKTSISKIGSNRNPVYIESDGSVSACSYSFPQNWNDIDKIISEFPQVSADVYQISADLFELSDNFESLSDVYQEKGDYLTATIELTGINDNEIGEYQKRDELSCVQWQITFNDDPSNPVTYNIVLSVL